MKMETKQKTHNLSAQKALRRQLRVEATPAEAVLWAAIKGKKIGGVQWRRQFSIGPFVLDFYCPKAKLGIELDGQGHYTLSGKELDAQRSAYIEQEQGIKLIRLENRLIWSCLEQVLEAIEQEQNTRIQTHSSGPSDHLP